MEYDMHLADTIREAQEDPGYIQCTIESFEKKLDRHDDEYAILSVFDDEGGKTTIFIFIYQELDSQSKSYVKVGNTIGIIVTKYNKKYKNFTASHHEIDLINSAF